MLALQAERDAVRYGAFEKKAQLTAEAERLKASMKESQLSTFRTETKSRYSSMLHPCLPLMSPLAAVH